MGTSLRLERASTRNSADGTTHSPTPIMEMMMTLLSFKSAKTVSKRPTSKIQTFCSFNTKSLRAQPRLITVKTTHTSSTESSISSNQVLVSIRNSAWHNPLSDTDDGDNDESVL